MELRRWELRGERARRRKRRRGIRVVVEEVRDGKDEWSGLGGIGMFGKGMRLTYKWAEI